MYEVKLEHIRNSNLPKKSLNEDDKESDSQKSHEESQIYEKEIQQNYWLKIWMTKDIATHVLFNREFTLFISLKEFIIYILYIIVLTTFIFSIKPSNMFFINEAFYKSFISSSISKQSGHITFLDITTKDQVYEYLENNFLLNIYGMATERFDEVNYILSQNELIGQPLLRQIAMTNDSCKFNSAIHTKIIECYSAYSYKYVDKNIKNSIDSFLWYPPETDKFSYSGQIENYEAHGTAVNLANNKTELRLQINSLKNKTWITRATRAVFLEFMVYNPNMNVFVNIKLLFEFSLSGGIFTSYKMNNIYLHKYIFNYDNDDSLTHIRVIILWIFLTIFFLIFIIEEITEVYYLNKLYFKLSTSYIDLAIIILFFSTSIIFVYSFNYMKERLKTVNYKIDEYPMFFEYFGYLHIIFETSLGILLFISWLKIFKYLDFTSSMAKISTSIKFCADEILGFALFLLLFMFSFAYLGQQLFGKYSVQFISLPNSFFTLYCALLGELNYTQMEKASSMMSTIYVAVYIVIIYFIVMNMFLAIIFDSYSRINSLFNKQTFEIFLFDYIKKKIFTQEKKTGKYCELWFKAMQKNGYPYDIILSVLEKHKDQGISLKSFLSEYQQKKLEFEIESEFTTEITFNKMREMEINFQNLKNQYVQEMELLHETENKHQRLVSTLLDLILESRKNTKDKKVDQVYAVLLNEVKKQNFNSPI